MKTKITLMAVTFGLIMGCANNGTLSVLPKFHELVMTTVSSRLTTSSAASLPNAAVGDEMDVNVYSFFKNCSGATLATCTDATPATADAWKCTSAVSGDYACNGNSALEYSCMVDHLMTMAKDDTEKCKKYTGKDITMTSYFPMFSTWGIPTTMSFQGVSSSGTVADSGEAFKWFRVEPTDTNKEQFIFALEASYGAELGYRNGSTGKFGFIWVNVKNGEKGVSAIYGVPETNEFEGYSVNVVSNQTRRVLANGTYVYYQNWTTANPSGEPNTYKCYSLTTKLEVADSDCETAFGITSLAAANEDKFTLKLFDATTITTANYSIITNPPDGATVTGCLGTAQ